MRLIEEIQNAARFGWGIGGRVYITFMVVDDGGNEVPGSVYPYNTAFGIEGLSTPAKFCTINIATNSCKMFQYDNGTGNFVYDVCVNGRTFIGSINPESVFYVYDPDNNKGYGTWIPKRIFSPIEEKEPEYKLPVLVAYNDHIIPKKSNAKLKLLH